MNKRLSAQENGFILVSVIVVLVVMALAFTAFSSWVDKAREQAADRQLETNARIQASDMFARVMYAYMTGRQNYQGVVLSDASPSATTQNSTDPLADMGFASFEDFISADSVPVQEDDPPAEMQAGILDLDGRVIDAGDGLRIMIQDRAGLIGLSNLSKMTVFSGLAEMAGEAGEGVQAEQLFALLADYQDDDSIRRVKGGERFQYAQTGLPAPTNGILRIPLELRNLLVWQEVLEGFTDAWLLSVFKSSGRASTNVNTAQEDTLYLISGNRETSTEIYLQRAKGYISSVFNIPMSSEEERGSAFYFIGPGEGIRFWSWHQNRPVAQVFDVQFSSLSPGQSSWYINWAATVSLDEEFQNRSIYKIEHPLFQ